MPRDVDDHRVAVRPIRQPTSRAQFPAAISTDHCKNCHQHHHTSMMLAHSSPASPAGSSLSSSDDGRHFSSSAHPLSTSLPDGSHSSSHSGSTSSRSSSSPSVVYPVRDGVPDCQYYLKTGKCNYGSRCKFNHPHRDERLVNALNRRDCFDFVQTGTCPYGRGCKYNHPIRSNVIGSPVSSAQGTPAALRFQTVLNGEPDNLGLPSAASPVQASPIDFHHHQHQPHTGRQQLFANQWDSASKSGSTWPSGSGEQSRNELTNTASSITHPVGGRSAICSDMCRPSPVVSGLSPRASDGCTHAVVSSPPAQLPTCDGGERYEHLRWSSQSFDRTQPSSTAGVDRERVPFPPETGEHLRAWTHSELSSGATAQAVSSVATPVGTSGYFVFVSGVSDAEEARKVAQRAAAATEQKESSVADAGNYPWGRSSSCADASRSLWGPAKSCATQKPQEQKGRNVFEPFTSPYGPSLFSTGPQTWGPAMSDGVGNRTASLFDLLSEPNHR
jgi:Zinc finger C-x8-C-x5-C-x3-H type (and similar)